MPLLPVSLVPGECDGAVLQTSPTSAAISPTVSLKRASVAHPASGKAVAWTFARGPPPGQLLCNNRLALSGERLTKQDGCAS